MPICRKCSNSFPNRVKINNKVKNLSSRIYCLDCSPFGRHNTKILDGKERKNRKKLEGAKCICIVCDRNYIYSRNKGHRKDICNSCSVTKSKRKTKEKAIQYKGGKCEKCGYNKCSAALCFHHKNPSKKDFGIGFKGQTFGWEKIKKEIEKCLLLCQNCHHELHYEEDSKKF